MAKKDKWRIFSYITNAYTVLMAVFLLVASNYQTITAIKTPLFYIICGGYTALCIVICFENVLIGEIKLKDTFKKLCPDSFVQLLMLCYAGLTLVSAILSEYPTVWLGNKRNDGFLTVLILVLCFYFVSKFAKPQKWMMYLFGAAVTVFCIISIVQLFGVSFLYPKGMNYYDAFKKYAGAYIGTIGNIDFVAAFFTLCIPAFSLYVIKAKEKQRFLMLIPIALSVGVLFKIWVLLGVIGVFVAAVCCFPFAINLKKRGHIIYWLSLVFSGLVGIALLYAFPFTSGMLGEIHSILHGDVSDTFGTGRLYIWAEVIKRVPDNILFGTGPDTMLYADIEPFKRVDQTYGNIVGLIDNAHNEYLNILFNQGIFATLCYVGAIGTAIVSFFKKAAKNKGVLIFGSAVIGYAVSAFFGVPSLSHTPFFWLCLGIFEHYCNKEDNK